MTTQKVSHPYQPANLVIPHYVENDKSLLEILGVFFALIGGTVIALWIYMGRLPHVRNSFLAKFKISWFLICGFIHFVLEGYFAVYYKTLPGEQTFLAQMWKEYGKGDSRYIIGDTFTVCMETITAFVDGPLAFLATYAFLANTPSRYVIQLLLSLCQLYGDVLYFSTEVKDDFIHGVMWHPLYFWFYFFFMNILWIIIPFCCVLESCIRLIAAQSCHDNRSAKGNNHNKHK